MTASVLLDSALLVARLQQCPQSQVTLCLPPGSNTLLGSHLAPTPVYALIDHSATPLTIASAGRHRLHLAVGPFRARGPLHNVPFVHMDPWDPASVAPVPKSSAEGVAPQPCRCLLVLPAVEVQAREEGPRWGWGWPRRRPRRSWWWGWGR